MNQTQGLHLAYPVVSLKGSTEEARDLQKKVHPTFPWVT